MIERILNDIEELKKITTRPLVTAGINMVLEIVKKHSKNNGWIPCSEKLPEEKGWYLVYAKNQRPFVAYFKGKTFPLNNHYHEIVAWMPLPEAYHE